LAAVWLAGATFALAALSFPDGPIEMSDNEVAAAALAVVFVLPRLLGCIRTWAFGPPRALARARVLREWLVTAVFGFLSYDGRLDCLHVVTSFLVPMVLRHHSLMVRYSAVWALVGGTASRAYVAHEAVLAAVVLLSIALHPQAALPMFCLCDSSLDSLVLVGQLAVGAFVRDGAVNMKVAFIADVVRPVLRFVLAVGVLRPGRHVMLWVTWGIELVTLFLSGGRLRWLQAISRLGNCAPCPGRTCGVCGGVLDVDHKELGCGHRFHGTCIACAALWLRKCPVPGCGARFAANAQAPLTVQGPGEYPKLRAALGDCDDVCRSLDELQEVIGPRFKGDVAQQVEVNARRPWDDAHQTRIESLIDGAGIWDDHEVLGLVGDIGRMMSALKPTGQL
jgi:hypothetical protein